MTARCPPLKPCGPKQLRANEMDKPASDSSETLRLLDQARGGDTKAVNRLCARHRSYLRQVIELRLDRSLRKRVDPSDLVQETLLEATRRLEDYFEREPMPFRLWLRKTAQQRVAMIHRKYFDVAARDVAREVPLPEQSSMLLAKQLLEKGSSPSQHAERREMARRVRRAVAQLPEAHREIILMRTFECMSYQEVAYMLGIEPATAKKRHGRALIRLHRVLVEGGLTSI